ncbi:MAG: DUF2380 domain-containing protein [Steroidobacteraceae bacterium]|nr:DUF2380 domain-containing protein [Steroidobacteraceae bacterium]
MARRILLVAALAVSFGTVAIAAEDSPVPIAVLDFGFIDSSGEPQDQSARHRALLSDFMASVRRDLERGGRFRVVDLTCGDKPCSLDSTQMQDVLDVARRAGARFVLVGGIHKVSTLIQEGQAQVVDVQTERLVFSRGLSFRGDNEQAWQRAQAFVANELLDARFEDTPHAAGK